LVTLVQRELAARGDPEKAVAMAAYMKTEMPFYGVQKPARAEILRRVAAELAPSTEDEYRKGIEALWDLAHREEKYLAIALRPSLPPLHHPGTTRSLRADDRGGGVVGFRR